MKLDESTADIKLTSNGDFALDEYGDLALATQNDLIDQLLRIVMMTTNPDWFYDKIGADLEELIGLDNSPETAKMGVAKIKAGLKATRIFTDSDIYVYTQAQDINTIVYGVYINTPFATQPVVYRIDMHLGSGAKIRRIQ